jgi:Tfp pilus assembly protein PilX
MMARLRRGEEGFALVTAVAILAIMTLLLIVVLTTGNDAFNVSEQNARFTRTLGVAEAGIDNVVTQLGQSRLSTNPCPLTPANNNVCTVAGGEYQVDWSTDQDGNVTITSVGYYPSKATAQVTRKIQAVYQPAPVFNYAIYSNTTVSIKDGQVVYGDIFANQSVSLGSGAVVCGSILSSGGDIVTSTGSAGVYKSYTDNTGRVCSGKNGRVWADGKIDLGTNGLIQGDATASAPVGTACPNILYSIKANTVLGQATACGIVSATTPNFPAVSGVRTDPPTLAPMPPFTWDPGNYQSVNCIPYSNPCNSTVTSATAYQQFNALSKAGMKGVYAVWQTNPSCGQITSLPSSSCTKLDLSNLTLSGDLTIVTNAPIDFGNTGNITTTTPATLALVSLYVPSPSSACTANNGGDCSIYGKNSIVFDTQDPNNPNDGVAGLLYTPGKCAFKNSANSADGAIYCGSMDIKNGFQITYNSRIAKIIGFGGSLQQVVWKELTG